MINKKAPNKKISTRDKTQEMFNRSFTRLCSKYILTKAAVIDFASKNPDMLFYTEDGMKMVIIGLLKLAEKISDKTKKNKEKTKVCIKKEKKV